MQWSYFDFFFADAFLALAFLELDFLAEFLLSDFASVVLVEDFFLLEPPNAVSQPEAYFSDEPTRTMDTVNFPS